MSSYIKHGTVRRKETSDHKKLSYRVMGNTTAKESPNPLSNPYQRLMELLTQSNGDLNCQNYLGETPLLLAIMEGNLSTIELLVEHGADVNVPDHNGYTPLMYAILINHKDIVEYLLAAGAKGELKNKQGKDSLDLQLHLSDKRFLVESAIKEQIRNQPRHYVNDQRMTEGKIVIKDEVSVKKRILQDNNFLLFNQFKRRQYL
jgi:ankyrin repeat protein